MKQQNNNSHVRKYKYVKPEKNESPQTSWSSSGYNSTKNENNKILMSGLDLDTVWSIKRNVSIDNKAKNKGENSSYIPSGMTFGGRKDVPKSSGTFYSRHKNSQAKVQSQPKEDFMTNAAPKSWLKNSYDAKKSPQTTQGFQNLDNDDEFDFDLLAPSKNKANISNNKTNNFNSFQHTGNNLFATSKNAVPNQDHKNEDSTFGSKYKASSYFNF